MRAKLDGTCRLTHLQSGFANLCLSRLYDFRESAEVLFENNGPSGSYVSSMN